MTALSSVNLFARDVEGLTAFYGALFDLPEKRALRSPIYRALAIGDILIGFNGYQAYSLLGLEPPSEPAGVKSLLTFEVADHAAVGRLTAAATALGAMVVKAPYDTAYGSRQSVLRDPEGNVFRINAFTPPRPAMIAYEPPKAADYIPMIDFSGAFSPDIAARRQVAWDVHKAARDTGFFYLTGHGVPAALMERQLDVARVFFAQALEKKLEIRLSNSAVMRGYDPMAGQALDIDSPPDLKESLVFGRELGPDHPFVRRALPFEGPNQWPDGIEGFRPQIEAYTAAMARLGQRLARTLALSLDLPEDYLDAGLAEPNCAVRLLHYPPHPADAAFNQLGAGAHTDWGLLTILLQDDRGGLEVRNTDGTWIRADPIPGTLVINLGDMVPRMTGGLYHSNLHRVLNRVSGTDRYSVATFFNPPFDYVFDCAPTCLKQGAAALPPLTFGEHIQDMIRRTKAA